MTPDLPFDSLDAFLAHIAELAAQLHAEAKCDRWGLSIEAFGEALRRSAVKHFGGARAHPQELEAYLKSLHLHDLALACACSQGIDAAWEFFFAQFKQDLRHAARAILRGSGPADEARAAELADGLYAELYGVRPGADGQRKSLFEYFHGRSKLSTWLRAILAQKQVDQLRAGGRTVPLEAGMEDETPGALARSVPPAPDDPDRRRYLKRVDQALSEALRNLAPRERMILACYYVDQLTLAEIGRMLREHESTVSRQLERTRRALRESVTQALQRETPPGNGHPAEAALDPAQVELAFEYAVEDWPFDLTRALSAAESSADPRDE